VSKPRIRALILDYGGVLSRPQDASSVQRMAKLLNQDAHDLIQVYRARRTPYDSGLVSGEQYWRGVLEHYGIDSDGFDISRMIGYDIQSWTQLNETMVRFVTKVRDVIHRLAVLSNMTQDTLASMRRDFHWLELFDVQVYSCEVGCSKPGREIYERCLDGLDVPSSDCLFVDDSPENVRGALQVGIPAFQFKTYAGFLTELEQFSLVR
jgi:HAD superfamily hydrolase (TIGR01509 family)